MQYYKGGGGGGGREVYLIIYMTQGLFQDFASEGANAKFQNSRGGQIQSQGGATQY